MTSTRLQKGILETHTEENETGFFTVTLRVFKSLTHLKSPKRGGEGCGIPHLLWPGDLSCFLPVVGPRWGRAAPGRRADAWEAQSWLLGRGRGQCFLLMSSCHCHVAQKTKRRFTKGPHRKSHSCATPTSLADGRSLPSAKLGTSWGRTSKTWGPLCRRSHTNKRTGTRTLKPKEPAEMARLTPAAYAPSPDETSASHGVLPTSPPVPGSHRPSQSTGPH